MPCTAREVRLATPGARARSADDFRVVAGTLAAPAPGEVLVWVHAFSLDPYQKIHMRRLPAGAVPSGGAIGRVVRSRHPAVPDGAWVTGEIRWSDLATVPGDRVTVVEPAPDLPRHAYVGLLGLSGLTAYFGMTRVLRPLPGERVVVSGASGAVGQVAMQIARLLGARPIGVVGSSAKRATLAQLDLPSVDRTIPSWPDELRERTGGGAEAYFDNVWGTVSARVIELLRPFGRVALCGQMSGLGEDCVAALDLDWFMFLARSLTLQGFRCADYAAERAQGKAQLADWYRSGQVVQQVRLVEGLHGAGAAFADLLAGRGTGKAVVLTGS